jgi:hypothetical protein
MKGFAAIMAPLGDYGSGMETLVDPESFPAAVLL